MKQLITLVFFFFCSQWGFAQLNMSLVSNLDYEPILNDIWGWEDPDTGIEYALVGTREGVSIVSLADPENPDEVVWIPGEYSVWRDIKTWGNYAYVVTDQSGTTEGLTIIDLSNLPASAPVTHWNPDLPNLGILNKCHNLYIDDQGYAYLSGCNVNAGGVLVVDVFSTPGSPVYVSAAPNTYSHDNYARDGFIYSAEINDGFFSIYDASDLDNITFINNQETPNTQSHNVWLSDDSQTIFASDELADAFITAYDISNPNSIVELDKYAPIETLNTGVIPHNVHVIDDYLVISFNSDGCRVVDASRPANLIEVAYYDTWLDVNTGFIGDWGAYPFLPSGLVLLSDRHNGLYVVDVEYIRACYLEGVVSNAATGANLAGVEVGIISPQANEAMSNLLGEYRTGQEQAGTFEVTFELPGFFPQTHTVELNNGELTTLDVELIPFANAQGSVFNYADFSGIPMAEVFMDGPQSFFTTADNNGDFQLNNIITGTYNVIAGYWGFETTLQTFDVQNNGNFEIGLLPGYYDDFSLDLGWETAIEGDVTAGEWEWVIPVESMDNGMTSSPGSDYENDLSDRCYITGNSGQSEYNNVDGGSVLLISPPMELSSYLEPILNYHSWFWNGSDPDIGDELVVSVHNGTDEVILETVNTNSTAWSGIKIFELRSYIDITDEMRIIFKATDAGNDNAVEAGIDAFHVYDGGPVNTSDLDATPVSYKLFPNPGTDQFNFQYAFSTEINKVELKVYNNLGQLVEQFRNLESANSVVFGGEYTSGMYTLVVLGDGTILAQEKLIKQ